MCFCIPYFSFSPIITSTKCIFSSPKIYFQFMMGPKIFQRYPQNFPLISPIPPSYSQDIPQISSNIPAFGEFDWLTGEMLSHLRNKQNFFRACRALECFIVDLVQIHFSPSHSVLAARLPTMHRISVLPRICKMIIIILDLIIGIWKMIIILSWSITGIWKIMIILSWS